MRGEEGRESGARIIRSAKCDDRFSVVANENFRSLKRLIIFLPETPVGSTSSRPFLSAVAVPPLAASRRMGFGGGGWDRGGQD